MHSLATAMIPVHGCVMRAEIYESGSEQVIAVMHGAMDDGGIPLVRIHSQCFTGDVLGSERCDCGPQLRYAVERIARSRRGILLYCAHHEGRGIGLLNKFKAYTLQDSGMDTVEANVALGLPIDARDYRFCGEILIHYGITRIRLMTNNPDKVRAMRATGIAVLRDPMPMFCNAYNLRYLETKKDKLGHRYSAKFATGHTNR